MERGLKELLAEQLRKPLPGRAAQARFAPELSFGRHFAPPPDGVRRAAVVALLYRSETGQAADSAESVGPRLAGWRLPLILRPDHLEHHAGQIGLPGGMIEPRETASEAALRELHEELGVPPDALDLLGQLSPLYVYISNNYVIPCLAVARGSPTFILNVAEVADVIELPVAGLLEQSHIDTEVREFRGAHYLAPYFRCGQQRIWGATAMILAELAVMLEHVAAR